MLNDPNDQTPIKDLVGLSHPNGFRGPAGNNSSHSINGPNAHADYMTNPNVRPEYYPPSDDYSHYVSQYEHQIQKTQPNQSIFSKWFLNIRSEELQLPIFLGILFFIFQLPFVEQMMRSIYGANYLFNGDTADGSITLYGTIFKSLLFSFLFFFIHRNIEQMSVVA